MCLQLSRKFCSKWNCKDRNKWAICLSSLSIFFQQILLEEVRLLLVSLLSLYKTLLYCIGNTKHFFVSMESNSLINSELIASLRTHELDVGLTSSCENATAEQSASAHPVLENQPYWLNYLLLLVQLREVKNYAFDFLRLPLIFFLKAFFCLRGKEEKKGDRE